MMVFYQRSVLLPKKGQFDVKSGWVLFAASVFELSDECFIIGLMQREYDEFSDLIPLGSASRPG